MIITVDCVRPSPEFVLLFVPQDLTEYSLTFENGRMKVDAHRKLNTGDDTDYVLQADRVFCRSHWIE